MSIRSKHHYLLVLGMFCAFSIENCQQTTSCKTDLGDKKKMRCDNEIDLTTDYYEITTLKVYNSYRLSTRTFLHFKQLKTLVIRCSPQNANCQSLMLEEGIFDSLNDTLEEVSLISHNIQNLPKNVFCGIDRLKNVDLSRNCIIQIDHIGFGESCEVPTSGQSMYSIDLRNNKIKYLKRTNFNKVVNLRRLYLSKNQLQNVEFGAFASLTNLNWIYLDKNELKSMPVNIFGNLTDLRLLALAKNSLSALPNFDHMTKLIILELHGNNLTSVTETVFKGLTNLAYLTLSDNELIDFQISSEACNTEKHTNTNCMPKLEYLELKANKIKDISHLPKYIPLATKQIYLSSNLIETIEKGVFAPFVSLTILDLTNNQIGYIEDGAFDHNTLLVEVYLDYNQLTTLDNLFDTIGPQVISASYNNIRNFSYTLHEPVFLKLNLSHNQLEDFTFHNLQQNPITYIMEIDFSFNNLTKIAGYHLFPKYATDIRLNDNSIETFTNFAVGNSINLKTLSLHNNKIQTFCEVYQILGSFTRASHTKVSLRGNPLLCSCENEWIKHNSNMYRFIEDAEFLTCDSTLPNGSKNNVMQNQNYFLCESNQCQCLIHLITKLGMTCNSKCPKRCNCYYSSNQSFAYIDCSRKHFTNVPNVQLAVDAMYLHLEDNHIHYLNEFQLSKYKTVRKLFLNNNLMKDFHEKAFQHGLEMLNVLNLRYNLLVKIPKKAFSSLVHLQELDLSRNRLITLDSFTKLETLQVIHLDNNNLSNYPVWEMENLTRVNSITLEGNPWSCECSQIDNFRNWLMLATNVINPELVTCTTGSVSKYLVSDNFPDCIDISYNIFTNYAPIWASVLGISSFLIATGFLVFIYRREGQVLLYSRYGIRIFHKSQVDMDKDKVFDIYVAYNRKDVQFLTENLLPGLEEIENPYEVILQERNVLAGGHVIENILYGINNSRRTIVLLSENFNQCKWCQFEFKMAHSKMLEDKCTRLIVIVMKKIPEITDPDLKSYMKTNTYLTWGERLFWKKLHFYLPDRPGLR